MIMLDEIERILRGVADGRTPDEHGRRVLRAAVELIPVVKAAEEWHDRQCTGEHQLCRETVDLHAQECAVEAREFDLYDAVDAMRARMGEQ